MTEVWKTPAGFEVIITGSPEQRKAHKSLCEARWHFTQEYCKAKGWSLDPNDLTVKQILEINSHEGWKNPIIER